jgi:hypothetical protein
MTATTLNVQSAQVETPESVIVPVPPHASEIEIVVPEALTATA